MHARAVIPLIWNLTQMDGTNRVRSESEETDSETSFDISSEGSSPRPLRNNGKIFVERMEQRDKTCIIHKHILLGEHISIP